MMMIMASSVLRSLRLALVVILEQKQWCVQGIFKEKEVGRPINAKQKDVVGRSTKGKIFVHQIYILFKQYTLPVRNRQEGCKKLVLLKRLQKKTKNVINIIANIKTNG